MSSLQLYPEIIDATTLGPRFAQTVFLPIGVEGQMDNAGTSAVGRVETVNRPSEADTLFGPASSLSALVKFLLDRGVPPVYAAPSKKGSAPLLADRQTAWALLSSDRNVRIRLTDSVTNADHVALETSCDEAKLINNKQFAFVGMPSGTAKSAIITAAAAINGDRTVLVAPGIYVPDGTLVSGMYAAAAVAAEVSKNADPTDDLDTMTIPNTLGIEKDSSGNDLFRVKVSGGTVVNDFEDLLQAGVSPLGPGFISGAAITHLRMTYNTDRIWDALATRIIVDQIFVLVRNEALEFNFLRKANTATNRDLLRSSVEALLSAHSDWIRPITQPDGTDGYGVAVVASSDERQMIISYTGVVNRGTQTILVDGNLEISV